MRARRYLCRPSGVDDVMWWQVILALALAQGVWSGHVAATPTPSSHECHICTIVTNFIKSYMDTNGSEEAAMSEAEVLCKYLGDYESQCLDIVKKYGIEIWKELKQNKSPEEICINLTLCNRTLEAIITTAKSVNGGITCDFCNMAITAVHTILAEGNIEDDVKVLILELCVYLGDLKQQCSAIINSNWDNIWHIIINKVEPDDICPLLFKDCDQLPSTSKMFYRMEKPSSFVMDGAAKQN